MSKYGLYYITKSDNKTVYNKIDISRVFKEYKEGSLESIDKFTSLFEDRFELGEYLAKRGIIPLKNMESDLRIRITLGKKENTVMYGPIFKRAKQYFSYEGIKNTITNLVYEVEKSTDIDKIVSDLAILRSLENYLANSYHNKIYAGYIKEYIDSKEKGLPLSEEEIDFLTEKIRVALFRQCHSYDSKNKGYRKDENGNPKIDYRGLHDIVAWYHFKTKDISINKGKVIPSSEAIEKDKPKKFVKKNEFPGQITIFDYYKIDYKG